MSETVVEKAMSLDAELRKQWSQMRRLARVVGGLLKTIKAEKLYKFVQRPGSRKGYVAFEEYASAVTGGVANSTVWYFMNIHSLTEGPNPVPAEDIDEMPDHNAYRLSKLKPEQRTRDLIERAKVTPIKKFDAEIQEIRNQSLPPEERKPVLVDVKEKWPPELLEMFEETVADFSLLDAVRDGDMAMSIRHKAIAAILISARTHAQDEIEAARHSDEEMQIAEEHLAELAVANND